MEKPQVTISLSHYNELLDYKERFKKLSVADYEVALSIISKSIQGESAWNNIRRELTYLGLALFMSLEENHIDRKIFVSKLK